MSSLANTILFVALVATSAIVALMYRKLKRLDAYHAEYTRIFDKTGEALVNAQTAVSNFGIEGRETLTALGSRIEEAKFLIERLEALTERAERQAKSRSDISH
jgi:hypothetical protein